MSESHKCLLNRLPVCDGRMFLADHVEDVFESLPRRRGHLPHLVLCQDLNPGAGFIGKKFQLEFRLEKVPEIWLHIHKISFRI